MRAILRCLILVAAAANVHAQGWQGIVPLHSNCSDLKQKIGIDECRNGTYDIQDFEVSILLSDGVCSSGWNVPAGTVISLDVRSKTPQQFSELSLDISKYRKTGDRLLPRVNHYESDDRSMSFTVSPEGLVTSFFYGPSVKDESLSCRSKTPVRTGSIKFDEYGDISRTAEEDRLNNFAYQLTSTGKSYLGYILVYGGGEVSPKEAHERGVRAKAYVVSRGVETTRLFVIDGGLRKALTVELFVTIRDTIPPTPRPTISPVHP